MKILFLVLGFGGGFVAGSAYMTYNNDVTMGIATSLMAIVGYITLVVLGTRVLKAAWKATKGTPKTETKEDK